MESRSGQEGSMKNLPRYLALAANYSDKHTVPAKALLDRIGGQVRKIVNDGMNTCAIRISDALNRSGDPILRMPGLYQLEALRPPTIPGVIGKPPDLYIVRVPDMKAYLERRYGSGKLI
jgi:hypothetical protein